MLSVPAHLLCLYVNLGPRVLHSDLRTVEDGLTGADHKGPAVQEDDDREEGGGRGSRTLLGVDIQVEAVLPSLQQREVWSQHVWLLTLLGLSPPVQHSSPGRSRLGPPEPQ